MYKETKELLVIAQMAANKAKEIICNYFRADFSVEWKADNTPVTIADKKAEECMRHIFETETPDFGIIGEEFGIENKKAEYQWIIDPIDGTKSFIHGVPLFGTLIALYYKNIPLVGVVSLPALSSLLYASKENGAFVDGNKVQVSEISTLKDSLVLSGTINSIEGTPFESAFTNIRRNARLYRGFGDCYGYYLTAIGKAEFMFDPVVSLWDIAPFPCIFKEAGGVFHLFSKEQEIFDVNGNPTAPIYEGFSCFASNTFVSKEVLTFFNQPNKK